MVYISGLNWLVTAFVVRCVYTHKWLLFTSPGRSPGRAIVLPPSASALASLLVAVAALAKTNVIDLEFSKCSYSRALTPACGALVTTSSRSAILSANYLCLVSYMSNDGHFSQVYLYCLVTALKSLLNMLYCRVTALDK